MLDIRAYKVTCIRTVPAMEGSLSPCNKAVAAPILRPQRAMVDVLPESLKCSITHFTIKIITETCLEQVKNGKIGLNSRELILHKLVEDSEEVKSHFKKGVEWS